jgi:hypothetical protein
MNDRLETTRARLGELIERAATRLRRLHRDEAGTSLTEFVIMLPVFLLIFNGVMILGEFTRKGTEAPIRAYKDTFANVLPFQQDQWFSGVHMHPASGAFDAGISQLAGDSKVHNVSGAVAGVANIAEGAAYTRLGTGGHMGESYARANIVTLMPGTKLQGCDGIGPDWPTACESLNNSSGPGALSGSFSLSPKNGKLTGDLKDLTGRSEYAYALFNDSISVSSFSGSGGGVLGMLNRFITGSGIRPALAANIRYGTVSGYAGEPFSFAGITMDMSAHYNVLVPPTPKGEFLDGATATAVARVTMAGHAHYDNLLGIDWSQPLSRKNIRVRPYFTAH